MVWDGQTLAKTSHEEKGKWPDEFESEGIKGVGAGAAGNGPQKGTPASLPALRFIGALSEAAAV